MDNPNPGPGGSPRPRGGVGPRNDSGGNTLADKAKDRGRQAIKQGIEKGAASVGVPPTVTRAAMRLWQKPWGKVVIILGVGGPPLWGIIVVVAMILGLLGFNGNAQLHPVAEERFPDEAMAAYRAAVTDYEDMPWTIVAAIATLATEHGKISPYPADTCDRNPEQEPLRATSATAEGCGDNEVSVYPEVSPPIGGGPKEGVGPYLLAQRAVRASGVNAQQLERVAGVDDDPESATDLLVAEMERIRTHLIEKEGWTFDVDNEEELTKFWTEVVRRLPIIDPATAVCPAPLTVGSTPTDVAKIISVVWRCELQRADELHVLRAVTNDDGEPELIELGPTEAVDTVTLEGFTVAWAWSGHGARNNAPSMCVPPPDAEEWAPAPLAGVFPLSESVFNTYADEVERNAGQTRCDAVANIRAAVRAFIAGEAVVPGEDGRTASEGRFAPMVGGWMSLPWAFGTGGELSKLYDDGPVRAWIPKPDCFEKVDVWLTAAQMTGGFTIDSAKAMPVRNDPSCAGSSETEWLGLVADIAQTKASELTAGDDAERVVVDGESPPEEIVDPHEHEAPEMTTTSTTMLTAIPTLGSLTTSTTAGETISIGGSSTIPSTTSTTLAPDDAATVAALTSFADELRSVEGVAAPIVAAQPGVDMLIERLSPSGKRVAEVPVEPNDSSPYATKIIQLAIAIGGLTEDDSRFDPDVDPFAGLFTPVGTGGTIAGVPEPMASAFAAAPAAATAKYPTCDITTSLVAAISTVESKSHWPDIGTDGTARPPIIGIQLNGGGSGRTKTAAVRDTDGGRLDGDTEWDRAVGPMQFIPGTWARHAVDGNGDGVADPQNIFDSAATAASYMCASAGGKSLQADDGKRQVIFAYNRADWYVARVLAAEAEIIAAASQPQGGTVVIPGGGTLTIVTVEGTQLAAELAPHYARLLAAARADGLALSAWGYRPIERQIELRRAHCGPTHFDIYEKRSKLCRPPTARPGSSQHERGLALDFQNCATRSTSCYQWLARRAHEFGLINYEDEPWHWSTTGR